MVTANTIRDPPITENIHGMTKNRQLPAADPSCEERNTNTKTSPFRPSVAWSFRPGRGRSYAEEQEQMNWRTDNRLV